MKRKFAFLILSSVGLFLGCFALIAVKPGYAEPSATIAVTEDSLIDPNNPAINYDNDRLEVTFSNFPTFAATRRFLLQFDLSSRNEPITDAVLSLTIVENNLLSGAKVDLALYAAEDGWSEEGVTWENRPLQKSLLQSVTVSAGFTGELQFSAAAVATYLETNRTSDHLASFYLILDGGTEPLGFGGSILFENHEGTADGVNGNEPVIVVAGAQSIDESTFLPIIQR